VEGYDAGEGDVEIELKGAPGGVPVFGEAMHHPTHPGRALFGQDAQGVFPGVAAVDDERFAGEPGGADMGAEALTLPFRVTLAVEIIEAGFADGDGLGMTRERRQLFYAGFMRDQFRGVYANRGVHVRIALRNSEHAGQAVQINRYAEQVVHSRGVRGCDGRIEITSQGGKIETIKMTMRIGEHERPGRL